MSAHQVIPRAGLFEPDMARQCDRDHKLIRCQSFSVMASAVGAPTLLHLRLEHMSNTAFEFTPDLSVVLSKLRPIVVVEVLLHDLEGPPVFDRIPSDHVFLQSAGLLMVAGGV